MGFLDFLFETTVEEETGAVNNNQQSAPVAPSNPGLTSPSENEDVEKFVLKFRNAIEQQGGTGAKFIQILYKLSKNPDTQDYEKALSLLQIMDPTLTVQSIIDSLSESERMVSNERSSQLKIGNDKISKLTAERDSEKEGLNSKISSIKNSIQSLEDDLNQKKAELKKNSDELSMVDQKYQPELLKTQQKTNAVSTASDCVLQSIAQLKKEIINNLK